MKKKSPLILSILFITILMGCGHDDSEKEPKDPEILYLECPYTPTKAEMDSITGHWKLVKHFFQTETSIQKDSIDYSCTHIIFHFRKDGILEIISDDATFPDHTFLYEYKPPARNPLVLPGPNLKIFVNPETTGKSAPNLETMEGDFFGIAHPSSLSITHIDHLDFKELIRIDK